MALNSKKALVSDMLNLRLIKMRMGITVPHTEMRFSGKNTGIRSGMIQCSTLIHHYGAVTR